MSKTNSLDQDHSNSGRSSAKNVGMIMNESKSTTDNYSWGNGSEVQDVLGDGGDLLGGFAWPPRSYTCTFCKREFRSAQALGGHMNVHRRDRARLRQMPSSRDHLHLHPSNYSLFNLNLDPTPHYPSNLTSKPNPNPNFSPYSFSSNISSSAPSMSPHLISSSPSSPQPNFPCVSQSTTRFRPIGFQNLTMISQIPSYGACKYDSFPDENEGRIVKKSEIVRLNLEIGLLGETKSDDLDLELRLGCS